MSDRIAHDSSLRDTTTGGKAVLKLHDNGDGTFAPEVYVEAALTLDPTNLALAANQTNGSQKAIVLPTRGAPTDRSGSVTSGGTSQQIMAGNAARVYLFVQNISDAAQYINFGADATVDTDSIKLAPGDSWENPPHFCPNGTVTLIGATTAKKFVAKEG